MTASRHIGFSLRRAEGEPTPTDPAQMTIPQLQEFVRQGNASVLVDRVREAIRTVPWVSPNNWPVPVLQPSGDSCQVVAISNGIRAYQAVAGQEPWSAAPAQAQVDPIRRRAGLHEKKSMAQSNIAVAMQMREEGLLEGSKIIANPIEAAEVMVNQRGFGVIADAQEWHALTIVPNFPRFEDTEGDVPEFIVIDSLDGEQRGMFVEEYINLCLDRNYEQDFQRTFDESDELLVCRVIGDLAPAAESGE